MRLEPEQYRVVGACLAAARRRAKLTQIQAAERFGRTQSFASEIERGLRRVDVLVIIILIARTACQSAEAFCRDREISRPGINGFAEDQTRSAGTAVIAFSRA